MENDIKELSEAKVAQEENNMIVHENLKKNIGKNGGQKPINKERIKGDEGITTHPAAVRRSSKSSTPNYSSVVTKTFANSRSRTTCFAFFGGIVSATPKQDVQDGVSEFFFVC